MRLCRKAVAALVVVVLAAVWAAPASGSLHLRLTKSAPAKDAELGAAPAEIRLWFSQNVELSVSSIKLTAADGDEIDLGKVETAEADVLVATTPSGLAAGVYQVAWRTSSGDGHPIRGTFDFAVAATE